MKWPGPINWKQFPEATRWLNQLLAACKATEVRPSPNMRIQKTTGGTHISVGAQATGADTVEEESTNCPFDIILTPQMSPPDFDLTIIPGTLNSQVPANLLDVTTYDPTTTVFVKIVCVTDGKTVTSSSVVIDTSPPAINEATENEGASSLEVCIAVVANGTIYKTIDWCGSIQVALTEQFIVDKVSPAVGESPYTRWYFWTISPTV